MNITNLRATPHLLAATLELIEKSFHYTKANSFSVDFAPLMDKSNHHNCFVLYENEKVIAHIGVCERKILGMPIAMLGGIAVEEARRGEGHFNQLLQEVLSEKRSEVACFILWSDQEKLYRKFGFYLCGTQIENALTNSQSNFLKTKLSLLNQEQFAQVQNLYQKSFCHHYTSIQRTPAEWEQLKNITSSDLYIREQEGKISDYFIMNKGQDLSGIIFEYASLNELGSLLNEISGHGKVWSGLHFHDGGEAQYQFFLAPGETKLFARLIGLYTQEQILIRDINPMKQEVYFYFNEELLSLEVEEFLRGVLGPGPFEELGELKPVFISGLDSI